MQRNATCHNINQPKPFIDLFHLAQPCTALANSVEYTCLSVSQEVSVSRGGAAGLSRRIANLANVTLPVACRSLRGQRHKYFDVVEFTIEISLRRRVAVFWHETLGVHGMIQPDRGPLRSQSLVEGTESGAISPEYRFGSEVPWSDSHQSSAGAGRALAA